MAIVAGVDFGTLSVRVTLVDSKKGPIGTASVSYPLHRRLRGSELRDAIARRPDGRIGCGNEGCAEGDGNRWRAGGCDCSRHGRDRA